MHRRAVVALVCVGTFMTTLDASIVNIGLPSIARAFGTPLTGEIEWVMIGYLVVIAALLLTFGRLSDAVGRRPIWTAGLAVFTLGSALCGAAPSLDLLIAARAIQGVGSALILATSTAILTGAVPPTQRGRALGLSAAAVSLGVTAGPTVGGLLTESLSWRWIFYVNVPIGLGAIAATLRVLPRTRGAERRGHFDPAGALLLAVGVAALNVGLSFGARWGWISPHLLGTLALAACAVAGAVLVERRAPNPVLDLRLFRNRVFVSALVSMTFSMLALFAVSFLLPFYLEELRGFSAARSGQLLTPYALTIGVVAPIAGAGADRVGSRWLAPLGLAIAAGGLLLLARLDAASSTWDVVWRLVVAGIGQSLFQSPNTRAVIGAAPATEQGEASGLLATARVTGQALSVAVAGAVFGTLGGAAAGSALVAWRVASSHASAPEIAALQATFVHGFRAALLVCVAFATAGALAALVRGRER
ncbi:MAG: DHA2 family efflux MFS transporter permease subunit [Gemmatimonadaceae bacterium]